MRHRIPWIVAIAMVLPLLLTACGGSSGSAEEASGPATVELIEGTDLSRITLTAKAVERLDIQTAAVEKSGAGKVIPYSAVLYSPNGVAGQTSSNFRRFAGLARRFALPGAGAPGKG